MVTEDGVRLGVRDYGGSGPSLVLIHGFFGNLGGFDDFAPRLMGRYRVVAYDQRGHGWSESGPTSVAAYVDDLRTVIEALDLGDAVLYGGSFGALVALAHFAAGHGARAFVNEDGQVGDWPPEGPGDSPHPDGPRILRPDQVPSYLDFWKTMGPAGTATAHRSMQARGDGRVELRPTQTELNAKGLAFADLAVLDAYRVAAGVPVWLLVATGKPEDEMTGREAAIEQLVAICPKLEVRRFSTGHWITAEDPAAAAEAIAELSDQLL